MSPARAAQVVAQVAEALDDAHRAGVIHRDVKPGNVLVRDPVAEQPFVYLCDFGIAQTGETGHTATGAVAGSWSYLSPERLNGAPATPASDIYALGCLLHACLTGQPPYSGTDAQVATAHLAAPVPQLPAGPDTAHLNVVLARATAKDPAQRYPSARAMRADLLGHGAPLSAAPLVPPPPVEPATRTRGQAPSAAAPSPQPKLRRRRTALLAGVAALTLIVAATVLVWTQVRDDDDTPADDDPPAAATDAVEVLHRVVTRLYPDSTEVQPAGATHWSVEAQNLVDGRPRHLPDDQWHLATNWTIRAWDGDHEYGADVQHQPPDDDVGAFTWDCADTLNEPGTSECTEFVTGDGRPGVEWWYRNHSEGTMTHRFVVLADREQSIPEVSAFERLHGVDAETGFDEVKESFKLGQNRLMVIVGNSELLFPLPDELPQLPSYPTCMVEPERVGCPADLR